MTSSALATYWSVKLLDRAFPFLSWSRDDLFLAQFLDVLVGVAAHVADRHAGLLGLGLDHLDQVAAALLGQRRQVDADGGAGGVGVRPRLAAMIAFSTTAPRFFSHG